MAGYFAPFVALFNDAISASGINCEYLKTKIKMKVKVKLSLCLTKYHDMKAYLLN